MSHGGPQNKSGCTFLFYERHAIQVETYEENFTEYKTSFFFFFLNRIILTYILRRMADRVVGQDFFSIVKNIRNKIK